MTENTTNEALVEQLATEKSAEELEAMLQAMIAAKAKRAEADKIEAEEIAREELGEYLEQYNAEDAKLKAALDAAAGADKVFTEALEALWAEYPEVKNEFDAIHAARDKAKDDAKQARKDHKDATEAIVEACKDETGRDFVAIATKAGLVKQIKANPVSGNGGGGAKVLYPELDGEYPDGLTVVGGEFYHDGEKVSAQKWISFITDGLGMDMAEGGVGLNRKGDSGPRKAKAWITRYRKQ